jgi:hypothetical protein
MIIYFMCLFVFFNEFLEIGAWISKLLFTNVEDDLWINKMVTTLLI